MHGPSGVLASCERPVPFWRIHCSLEDWRAGSWGGPTIWLLIACASDLDVIQMNVALVGESGASLSKIACKTATLTASNLIENVCHC